MAEMSDNSLKNKISVRWLIFARYFFQTLVIVVVFGVIMFMTINGCIKPEVTATLLGVAVTSALKLPFRSIKDKSGDDGKDEH